MSQSVSCSPTTTRWCARRSLASSKTAVRSRSWLRRGWAGGNRSRARDPAPRARYRLLDGGKRRARGHRERAPDVARTEVLVLTVHEERPLRGPRPGDGRPRLPGQVSRRGGAGRSDPFGTARPDLPLRVGLAGRSAAHATATARTRRGSRRCLRASSTSFDSSERARASRSAPRR